MKKIMNRLLAGVLSLAAVFTTLPTPQIQAAEKQLRVLMVCNSHFELEMI